MTLELTLKRVSIIGTPWSLNFHNMQKKKKKKKRFEIFYEKDNG